MNEIIGFLVNDLPVETSAWGGKPALDFIREELGLRGVKEGCREGDCGACSVLVGRKAPSGCVYRAEPSCLLSLGELDGAHLLTIEGLRAAASDRIAGGGERVEESLNPLMRSFVEENASQCGFCTPGFIIALTAYLMEEPPHTIEGALRAVDGNLCRCTGYASIKRAARRIVRDFAGLPRDFAGRVAALEEAGILPRSVGAFARGEAPGRKPAFFPGEARTCSSDGGAALVLGGGTDFYVRHPDPKPGEAPLLLRTKGEYGSIRLEKDGLVIGAALAERDFFADRLARDFVPGLERFEPSIASILVRNRASLGGNIVNASPVADMSSMLLALGARLRLAGREGEREIPLESFFIDYKKIDLGPGELVREIVLPLSSAGARFNFEKAAKREKLDIATVNSAAAFYMEGRRILRVRISAGGVGPTPLLLRRCSDFLAGKSLDEGAALVRRAAGLASEEVRPISDVRGSAEYRKTVLGRFILAHFLCLFPGDFSPEELLS